MKYVYTKDQVLRATINKQSKGADTYNPAEPWLLLHISGRVDRFPSYSEARDEALKSYPGSYIAV